jgi:hypothetical protein
MRVTVSHNKTPQQVRQSIDKGFDDIFTGLPIAGLQFTDEKRTWIGNTLNFSFNAKLGIVNVPLKGFVEVLEKQVTIDIDLPSFLNQFLPEEKVKTAVESKVKGLLT